MPPGRTWPARAANCAASLARRPARRCRPGACAQPRPAAASPHGRSSRRPRSLSSVRPRPPGRPRPRARRPAQSNWVRNEPTPPAAPTISTILPSSGASDSAISSAVTPTVGSAAAVTGSRRRYPRQRRVLAAGHVLRVGAGRSQRRDQQLPEDLIPRREPGRAQPMLTYSPGQVGAEHHRERGRHHVLPPSVGDICIHRVHPGDLDRDKHLAGPGLRSGQLRDRRAGAVSD